MGILWTVCPLDDEMKSWLDETDVEYPDTESRYPTGHEIKDALSTFDNCDINIIDNGIANNWQAFIISKNDANEKEWALLNISEYSGNDLPQKLWFEKGWESLIHRILQSLVAHCGPLVLIADCGGDPVIISNPGTRGYD